MSRRSSPTSGNGRADSGAERLADTRAVSWTDLVELQRWETIKELLLPVPWLVGSLLLAGSHWYVPALGCSFFFYLAGLRLTHDAFHRNLGLGALRNELLQVVLSILMLGSMHAVRHNHLHHHRHCMEESDLEGNCAKLSWWKALMAGPIFPVRNHINAIVNGTQRNRSWIAAELVASTATIAFAVVSPIARYHVLAMLAGQCLSAFFCVWTVHRGSDGGTFSARTCRGRFRNWLFMGMFRHAEHHMFPRVPTCHLGSVADRLDATPIGRDLRSVF